MKKLLILSTWFQIVWFCAVLGNDRLEMLTVGLVAITLLASLLKGTMVWGKYALIAALGIAMDFANYKLGLFYFESHGFPYWLVALWLIFVWYANFLQPVLSQYPLLFVSLVGGIGGTLSYVGGEKVGAVAFGAPLLQTTGILFVEWTLMIAVILKVYGYEAYSGNSSVPSADR